MTTKRRWTDARVWGAFILATVTIATSGIAAASEASDRVSASASQANSCPSPKAIVAADQGLFATNGTLAGTTLLKAHVLGTNGFTALPNMAALGGRVVFVGQGAGANQLWITDGTKSGTKRYRLLPASANYGGGYAQISSPTSIGAKAVFGYTDGVYPGYGNFMWVTDGTAAGTFQLKGVNGPYLGSAAALLGGGRLIFVSVEGVWITDGTQVGTRLLKATNGDFVIKGVAASIGNLALFPVVANGANQIWRTNGTGTAIVTVLPGSPFVDNPPTFFPFDGKSLFSYNGAIGVSDGTAKGTHMLSGFATSSLDVVAASLGSKIVFSASAGVFVSDGTQNGTKLIQPVASGNPQFPIRVITAMTSVGGKIVFTAGNAVKRKGTTYLGPNTQLWQTDGTVAGTKRLVHFASDSKYASILGIYGVGSTVIASVSDGVDNATWMVSDKGLHRIIIDHADNDVENSATVCPVQAH